MNLTLLNLIGHFFFSDYNSLRFRGEDLEREKFGAEKAKNGSLMKRARARKAGGAKNKAQCNSIQWFNILLFYILSKMPKLLLIIQL